LTAPGPQRAACQAIRVAKGNSGRLVLLHLIDDFPTRREFTSVETLETLEQRRRQAGEAMLNSVATVATLAGSTSNAAFYAARSRGAHHH
jgi:hypothetical protein